MNQIFRSRWESQEGQLLDENGELSVGARTWLDSLSSLTTDQIKLGLESAEKKAIEAASRGDDYWPPSYAQFIGLAKPVMARGHKPFSKPLMLESDDAKQKRKEAGKKHCQELRNLLGE